MKTSSRLIERLAEAAKTENGITIVGNMESKKYIAYKKVLHHSMNLCGYLQNLGLKRGTEVIIQCDNMEYFIYSFWACIAGGYIAVPVSKAKSVYKDEVNNKVYEFLENPFIICDDQTMVPKFASSESYLDIRSFDFAHADTYKEVSYGEDDIIYVQFSSGSVGSPRGVAISEKNLKTNITDIVNRLNMDESDISLSWQPLTHCYGLTVFHILPVFLGIKQYLIATDLFMHSPDVWMNYADKYKATRLGIIPFAVKHFLSYSRNSLNSYQWNLHNIRSITIGGEQVSHNICNELMDYLKEYKIHDNVIKPIYGLAEATTGVCILEMDEPLNNCVIERSDLKIGDCIKKTDNSSCGMAFLQQGISLGNTIVEIMDGNKNILAENCLGHINVKGNNVAAGYYKNEAASTGVFYEDGWLDTGDIGFKDNNSITIVGREKEIIISNAVKYACVDIEGLVSDCLQDRHYADIAVCNGTDREKNEQSVIVFIEYKTDWNVKESIQKFIRTAEEIKRNVYGSAGLVIDYVIPVSKIPRTSSGKLRRMELTGRYNQGEFKNVIQKLDALKKGKGNNVGNYNEISKKQIRNDIVAIIERIFKLKVKSFEEPFKEYGIISVNIPIFMSEINKIFEIDFQVSDFFSYPNINSIVDYIYECLNKNKEENEIKQISQYAGQQEEEKIAIVGISCRFPGGANSIDEYWDVLMSGLDGICDIPESRWNAGEYYSEDEETPGKMYCRKGGFLQVPVDAFDAGFFNITPKEASALDPQQRLVLELTYEAFENGGIDITKYQGTNTGVYLGMSTTEYIMSHLYSGDLTTIDAYSLTGACMSTACGRISYTFGFEGPCISVDTACSSSLSALHIACEEMAKGEMDTAVVGGVNLMLSPANNVGFSKLHATSVDGHSKAFDESANGYGRSEGGGVLIIKRLSKALEDNDHIFGIVRGTAINQDGKSNGLTAPNGASQVKLIERTLHAAKLDAGEIDYVEMHGTGTKLGDPIEVSAVSETYGKNRSKNDKLKIGSVKSNIGHMEAAAGIGSIVKVLLCMEKNKIPANLHFNNPNPFIDWENSNIRVVDKHEDWDAGKGIRRAGINGFGFGGSNAHVIIEEYVKQDAEKKEEIIKDGINYILKITAKNTVSFNKQIDNYYKMLKTQSTDNIENIVYTANRGRSDYDLRLAVCGRNVEELCEGLHTYMQEGEAPNVVCNAANNTSYEKERKIIFMFTGQGSQYVNMGRLLFENNAVYRDAFCKCENLFKPYILKSIVSLLFDENADSKTVENTAYAQTLIFALEYSLYKMMESIGIIPEIVMGHSIGEYAAAVAASIIKLEDAVKLVAIRGRLMDSVPGSGAMGSLFAGQQKVNAIIEEYKGRVSIAAHNAKESFVISGEEDAINEIADTVRTEGIKFKKLKVSQGFHSEMMSPILEDFRTIANEVEYHKAKVRFASCLYGREIEEEILDSEYWTTHIRETVNFYKTITHVADNNNYILLEVGATRVLSSLCKLIYGDDKEIYAMMNLNKDDREQIAQTIASLYTAGINIKWDNVEFMGQSVWNKIRIPTYAFNRDSYWKKLGYDNKSVDHIGIIENDKLLGQKIDSPSMEDTIIFQRKFTMDTPFFMGEHIIFDTAISPAAAHISMLLSAVRSIKNPKSVTLKEMELQLPLAIQNDEERNVQVCLENITNKNMNFSIVSKTLEDSDAKWMLHTKGQVEVSNELHNAEEGLDIEKIDINTFDTNIDGSIYDFMRNSGFRLGEGFQRITKTNFKNGKGICYIEPLKSIPDLDIYELYPGVIDSILQTLFCGVLEELVKNNREIGGEKTIIPYYIGRLEYNYVASNNLWVRTIAKVKEDVIYADLYIFNEEGQTVMSMHDIMAKFTDKNILLKEIRNNYSSLYYHTDWTAQNNNFTESQNKKLMVIADKEESQLIKYLKNETAVTIILRGKVNKELKDGNYVIDDTKEGYKWLINAIKLDGHSFKIVYESQNSAENNMTYKCLQPLVNLVKAIIESGVESRFSIKIITNQVQGFENDKEINLNQSILWGFVKTLGIENAGLLDGIVDIDYSCLGNSVNTLYREIICSGDKEVILRGEDKRYISRLKRLKDFIADNKVIRNEIQIKEDVSYLITGGTGALGLVYAEYLSEMGAKNIVLMSRSAPKAAAKEKINQLEEAGVNIVLLLADVCNLDSVKSALRGVQGIPIIKGVIHAAGTLCDNTIDKLEWEQYERVLNPKVMGVNNIYQALDSKKLDFFIMLSSISSVVGNIGQSNYAAANYYMNIFSEWLNQKNIPGYVFCWGPFKESGMAVSDASIEKNMQMLGITLFNKEAGKHMIGEFFKKPYDQIVIADIDWSRFIDSEAGEANKQFIMDLIKDGNSYKVENNGSYVSAFEDLSHMEAEEREKYLSGKLQLICAKIMGFGKGQLPDKETSFKELGVDSLMVFSMRTSINKLLGTDINVSSIFNYPTINKLTHYLIEDVLFINEEEEDKNTMELLDEFSKLTE